VEGRAGQARDRAPDLIIGPQDLERVFLAVLGQRHFAGAVDQLTTDPGAAHPGERDVGAEAPGRLELRRGVRLEVVAGERQLRGARVPELTAATDRAVMKRVAQTVEAQGPPDHTITVKQDEQVARGVAAGVPRRPRRTVLSVWTPSDSAVSWNWISSALPSARIGSAPSISPSSRMVSIFSKLFEYVTEPPVRFPTGEPARLIEP
jgi:hypothetical protein